jgi:hypothetical protein
MEYLNSFQRTPGVRMYCIPCAQGIIACYWFKRIVVPCFDGMQIQFEASIHIVHTTCFQEVATPGRDPQERFDECIDGAFLEPVLNPIVRTAK